MNRLLTKKQTMTLNLTDAEMDALEKLSDKKDISKTAVMRQALRLYLFIDKKQLEGKRLILENPLPKKKTELFSP